MDYIFIPRIECLYEGESLCVKLFALADIVRNTFENVPMLEYSVDKEKRLDELVGMIQVGLKLGRKLSDIRRAYSESVCALIDHQKTQQDKQLALLDSDVEAQCRILLVAHSYVNYDALLGKTVARILESLGAQVVYADILNEQIARELSPRLSEDCYWTYNKELLGGIEFYRERVDGIIFLMAFPCGPDALIASLCQHVIHDLPLCMLNMDELQGDTGLKTRLESFIDILLLRKEKLA